jgi:uncharacterized membrane protein YjjP (DUF1212 family)
LKKYLPILLITLIGAYLRFNGLGDKPLFVDEALFGLWVRGEISSQELFPVLLLKPFNPSNEFSLRLIFALAGTLTIPALYMVIKRDVWIKSGVALFVAVFPLFVFWSRMARPYALAGLFLVLGWKWYAFYIPALLTTPISLIGIKLFNQKWYVLAGAFISAIIFFLIRQDTGENGEDFFKYAFTASRFYYLPALTIILYVCNYKK